VINKSRVGQSQKFDIKIFESSSSMNDANKLPMSINSSANYFKEEEEDNDSNKKLGTIYETPTNSDSEDIESELTISQLNLRLDEKVKNYVKNHQMDEEEVYEDIIDESEITINQVNFKIKNQIDLNYLKTLKNIPIKVFYDN
jgi:hypothetical protein